MSFDELEESACPENSLESFGDENVLDILPAFLLEEHRQRSSEIMQNKIWRYSVRIFAVLSLYIYHTKIYIHENVGDKALATIILMIILLCCVLYSMSLRYRTRFNAEYKRNIENFFMTLSFKIGDKNIEDTRRDLNVVGWEMFISDKRKEGKFDIPQIVGEILVWIGIFACTIYYYAFPILTDRGII